MRTTSAGLACLLRIFTATVRRAAAAARIRQAAVPGLAYWAAAVAGLACWAVAPAADARAGALDPSFGRGGVAQTGVPAGVANAVVLQPDGKIVIAVAPVAGGSQPAALVRLLPDGSLDSSFGQGGVAPIALSNFPFTPIVNSAALQSDGKIVLCGGGLPLTNAPAFVARVQTDGSPDAGFGDGGTVTSVVPYAANVVLVDPSGDILAGGGSTFASATAVARLTADGAFDPTFGNDGIASFTSSLGAVYGLAAQSDGKYLLLGQGVLGIRSDGARAARDGGGTITASAHVDTSSFVPDGKVLLTQLVASGPRGSAVQTLRYLRSDALDPRFASPTASFGYGPANTPAYLHRAGDGAIVVDGVSVRKNGAAALGLVRYHAEGALDESFGNGGTISTPLGTQLDAVGEFAIQPDRNIVVSAVATIAGTPSLVVVRYLGR